MQHSLFYSACAIPPWLPLIPRLSDARTFTCSHFSHVLSHLVLSHMHICSLLSIVSSTHTNSPLFFFFPISVPFSFLPLLWIALKGHFSVSQSFDLLILLLCSAMWPLTKMPQIHLHPSNPPHFSLHLQPGWLQSPTINPSLPRASPPCRKQRTTESMHRRQRHSSSPQNKGSVQEEGVGGMG